MKTLMNIMKFFLLSFATFIAIAILLYTFGVAASKELEKTGLVYMECDSAWQEFKVDMAASVTDVPYTCIGSVRHKEAEKKFDELKKSFQKPAKPVVDEEPKKFKECSSEDVLMTVVGRYSEERTVIQTLDPEEFLRKFKDNTMYQPITESTFYFSIYEEDTRDDSTVCYSQLEVKFVSPDGKELVERKSVGWKHVRANGFINLVDFKF